MDDNASLEDFLGGETATMDATSDGNEDDEVTPATTTYAWDGDGAACEACGEVTERRWQHDGALVCVSCKEW